MGFQSTIVVLNDCLHDIRNDEKFGQKLADGVSKHYTRREYNTISAGCSTAGRVVAQDHADTYRCLIVGGNGARDLGIVGFWSSDFRDNMTEEQRIEMFLRNLAENHGFRLVRKSKKD